MKKRETAPRRIIQMVDSDGGISTEVHQVQGQASIATNQCEPEQ